MRSSGLNSCKGLLEVGPSSYLNIMKTVGISGLVGAPTSVEEVGCFRVLGLG